MHAEGGLLEWDIIKALPSPTVDHSDIARTVDDKTRVQSTTPTDVKSEGKYQVQCNQQ